jgi:DNA helicase-2/ATP-dependent DNA helicase PcrA
MKVSWRASPVVSTGGAHSIHRPQGGRESMLGRYDDFDNQLGEWGEDYDQGMEGSLSERVKDAREAVNPTLNQERLARLVQGMTPQQFEAATYDDKPLLVLAGAGTGKTRTLTVRIALLVTAGLAMPSEILALTFTNKAAAEMKQRIAALLELDAVAVHATTFHAFCARMMRDYGGEVGWKTDWTMLDEDDMKKMMRQCWKERFGAPPEADVVKSIVAAHDDRFSVADMTPEKWATYDPAIRQISDDYQARKEAENVKDFSDLITQMNILFDESEFVTNEIRRRFKYVLVDEYQDTDSRQEELLRKILGDNRNITVVGDEDQLVYTWRHAQIENILEFCDVKRWNAHQVRLEQNFRSTQNILTFANRLVKFNHKRLGKELFTYEDEGERVRHNNFDNPFQEAEWIVKQIQADIARGVPREEIAVLVRASHALNMVEQALNHVGIRYTLSGGKKFQDRQEIKDISAYLRLVANAQDRMAFERAIAAPKRNVGPQMIEEIDQAAKRMRTDITDAAYRMALGGMLTVTARQPVLDFCEMMSNLAADAVHGADAETIVRRIINDTGYGDAIKKDLAEAKANAIKEDVEALTTRIKNIGDLLAIAQGKTLHEFLDHLGLSEANRRDEGKGVWIGTIHAAKGLEFYNVYLPAWEQGVLPSGRTLKEGEDIEEERRLGYVAITRARHELCMTWSASRFNNESLPSVFLADLGIIPRPSGPGYDVVDADGYEPVHLSHDVVLMDEDVPF